MKFATIMFSILLFINGILLAFQFHVFSSNSNEEEKAFSYAQDIEVTYRGNRFFVKQTFTGLPENEITITWPETSKNKSCEKNDDGKKDEQSCSRLTKHLNSLKAGSDTKQTITYTIPLSKKGFKSGTLFEDAFVTLKNGITGSTTLQIVDENRKGGHWFTGLPKLGERSLTLVDYSYFQGNGGVYELYWTKDRLKKTFDATEVSVYAKNISQQNLKKTMSSMKMLNSNHIDIVEATGQKNGSRIIFTNSMNKNVLQEKVVVSQIKEQYQFSSNSGNLPLLVASFATNTLLGNQKTQKMVQILNNTFNNAQSASWNDGLSALKGKKIDAGILDQLLSKTLNNKTSYFKMNEASGNKVVPLLFEEKRDLYLNDEKLTDVKIILKDGEILYAANPMLKHLGYKTRVGKNGYYVDSSVRKLRFPGQQYDFYVDNDVRMDLAKSRPIVEVSDTYYIEESWLIRLFGLTSGSSNERIDLQSRQ
ncbi:MAG: hypothetical protein KBT36_01755 [Kurthia sp.]|nr:hypothetical protein [Candidatus Kurthia equi]